MAVRVKFSRNHGRHKAGTTAELPAGKAALLVDAGVARELPSQEPAPQDDQAPSGETHEAEDDYPGT